MRSPRLRGMVLAAGLGSRLRPLTAELPKPLLPVLGKPALAHTLGSLAAAGCEAAAINLHHNGDQIRRFFGDSFAGMPLTWSVEPRLLGTLGALEPLHDFLAGAEIVLLVNGDSLCRWPLAELAARQRQSGTAATLLMTARADPASFGGGVAVGRGGAILSFRPPATGERGARRLVFAGAHALAPHLVARIPSRDAAAAQPADIVRNLYEPLLTELPGCLGSLTTARRWHDLGTPRRFLAATLDWLPASRDGAARSPARPRRWIARDAVVDPAATVRCSSVEAGARIGPGATVERSAVLPGAMVGDGAVVRESILGPGAVVQPGAEVVGRLVTAGAGAAGGGVAL